MKISSHIAYLTNIVSYMIEKVEYLIVFIFFITATGQIFSRLLFEKVYVFC